MERNKDGFFFKALMVTAAACLVYGISSGIRANYGVMLGALVASSGVSYASVSFVLAVAQLVVGLVQPVVGVLAIKRSNSFVLCLGALMMVCGLVGIPFCHSRLSLLFFLSFLLSGGIGALAFGVVMGAVTPILGEKRAAVASGFVSASSGLGGTVLSPVMQLLIESAGLRAMLLALCVPVALLIPLSLWMAGAGKGRKSVEASSSDEAGLLDMFKNTIRDRNYLRIFLSFFTCGFYMSIIETHLFTQYTTYGFSETLVAFAFSVYGIGAMLGCILTGFLGTVFNNKWVLGGTYASRILIPSALILLPKSTALVYITAFLFGMSGNATVPPTSGLITGLFGAKKLAALFGVAYLIHQVGSFFSSWLGGICVEATGDYNLIWLASIVLSAAAALLCFTIKNE